MTPKDTPHTAMQGAGAREALLADSEIPDQFKYEGHAVLVIDRMQNFHTRLLVLGVGGGIPFWLSNDEARAALAQRQSAPADPQATSQEARTVDHLPGTTGDSLQDAMKWAASREAREYPPLPKGRAEMLNGDYTGDVLFTAQEVYACIDSDRKARQQEALDARRLGPRMTAALLAAAEEALEFVEGQEDVIDGPYGNPRPNKAMQVAMSLRAVIGAANEAAKP